MGRRFWILAAASTVLVVGVVAVIDVFVEELRLTPRSAFLISDAAQLLGGIAATGACWWIACYRRGAERHWRIWMGAGMAGWVVGMVVRTAADYGGTHLTTPSTADLGFFWLPVCAFVALLAFASAAPAYGEDRGSPVRTAVWTRTVFLLDGLVVAGSFFLLAWVTALDALVTAGAPTAAGVALSVYYPMSQLVLLTVMVLLVSYHRVQQPRQLFVFGLAQVAFAVSEGVNAYVVISGSEWTHLIAHVGFIAGPLLILLAAVATDKPRPQRRERPMAGWGHLILPYVPILLAGGVIVGQTAMGQPLDNVVWLAGFVVLTLIVVRQFLTLVDNTTLLSNIHRAQERLAYQASHDSLTGLANQRLFEQQLSDAVWLFRGMGRPFALLYIDLDDFKAINDDLGHFAGDALLQALAGRLRGCVSAVDLVARLGGDEFAILLEGDAELAHRIRDRVTATLRRPFAVAGRLRTVHASTGLVVADASDPDLSPEVLLRRADAAMYAVKRDRKRPGPRSAARHRSDVDLHGKLVDALRSGSSASGLDVYYQPIVRIADRELVALEALARWTCPGVGVVPPDVFVALAEQGGLVAELDNFVLNRACGEVTAVVAQWRHPPALHVNVSAARLGDTGLVDAVCGVLRRHALPGERLVLEITETSTVPDFTVAADVIERLRRQAVRFALDDFGTGYNTLAHLHQFPVDMVKVDQAFAISPDEKDETRINALRRSIVAIAHALEVDIVIEGVEAAAQAEELAQLGYKYGQGYLYGAPAPLEKLRRSDVFVAARRS